jgi:large repetitive protein
MVMATTRRRSFLAVLIASAAAGCSGERDGFETLESAAAALEVGEETELDPPDLVPAAREQSLDELLFDGEAYLAVWTDSRESFGGPEQPPRAFAARVGGDGSVLDPTGLPIAPPSPEFRSSAGVAGACADDGTCLLVATNVDFTELVGVRVAGGQVLDPEPVLLVGGGTSIATWSVAWDGASFRLAWADSLEGIFAAPIAADGQVGESVQIASWPSDESVAWPQVACEGERCLVVFGRGGGAEWALLGRFIDTSGPVGDEFVINDAVGQQFPARPHWDGMQYWVAFRDHDGSAWGWGAGIRVTRVAQDGAILDPSGIEVEARAPDRGLDVPHVGHDGANLTLAWSTTETFTTQHRLFVARVSEDGEVLDPGGAELSPDNHTQLQLACHVGQCLAGWTAGAGGDPSLFGTRLEGVSELDDDLVIATSPPGQAAAAAAFGSGRYAAVWQDSRPSSEAAMSVTAPIRGAVFDPAMTSFVPLEVGLVPGGGDVFRCPAHDQPTVAASDTSYLVAWHEGCSLYDNLYAQLFDLDGEPLGPTFGLDETTGVEKLPAAASSGDGYLAVWESREPSPPRNVVRASRFDAAGAPQDGAGAVLASGLAPEVAFDGTNYLVAWIHDGAGQGTGRDVRASRVGQDGTVLDGDGLILAATSKREDAPSVACGAGMCLVVWREGSPGVRAARVAADGSILDPGGVPVGQATGGDRWTSVTFDGESFLVAWRTGGAEVFGARVSIDGVVSPEGGELLAAPDTAAERPIVASDGAGHSLLVYDRYDPSPASRARRVRARVVGD